MRILISITFIIFSLSGCTTGHFYVGTDHPITGEPWSFYKTYEFCGIKDLEIENIGIFVAENGGFFGKGDLNVWVFNLSDVDLGVENFGVDYYLFSGLGVGHYKIDPSGRVKIASKIFKFTESGDFYNVKIKLNVNNLVISQELELKRFNFETVDRVRKGCGDPQSREEFYEILNQQKHMSDLLSKKRDQWNL